MGSRGALIFAAGGLLGLLTAAAGYLALRFQRGRHLADRVWAATDCPKLADIGAVKHLSILPLIDWYAATSELLTEPGVSYLVRAGNTTLLFDVGFNAHAEHPSPLLRNMATLGLAVAALDAIFISHMHEDHVGGIPCQLRHTFALSAGPVDLRGIPAWVPQPMTQPGADVRVVTGPQVIAPGVATTGVIPRQMFFLGWTQEQSMVVNVEGKGLVIIVGCGHPTLERILERVERCFDAPIYGVVGGLHYPVTASREMLAGIPLQRILGTGKWPWDPINRADVRDNIALLQSRHPFLVGLSPHDSCDWSITAFRKAFGPVYRDVWVGQEIVVQ
jgi:7,8-dihydropterin-6-yl-methyl-4-(beta-D-ribofuranosyl)aminobenzene 5'-phosphate synthase